MGMSNHILKLESVRVIIDSVSLLDRSFPDISPYYFPAARVSLQQDLGLQAKRANLRHFGTAPLSRLVAWSQVPSRVIHDLA